MVCVLSSKLSVMNLRAHSTSEVWDSLTTWVCLCSQETQVDSRAGVKGEKPAARTNPDSTVHLELDRDDYK